VGDAWDRLPGAAVRISMDRNGLPRVVNQAGTIFRG
jgi:hypothetical protein